MGRYRARDLLLVPGWLSLARIPLAFLFAYFAKNPAAAVFILFAAAVTDVADGWYARRFEQATPIGSVVDGITDKVFVLVVVSTLFSLKRLHALDLVLLATRELGELPLVLWWAFSRRERKRRASTPQANTPGKLATTLQFATVACITAGVQHVDWLIGLTASAGAAAAWSYWHRELRARAL